MTPEQFYEHARTVADAEGRLPLSRMTGWDVFPFEQNGLRVAPLAAPCLPEPPRNDLDEATCGACARRDTGSWHNENWRLNRIAGAGVPLLLMLRPRDHYDLADLPDSLAGELGVLTAHLTRAVEALPHIARAHVMRIGDGTAHLHVWIFGRPEGQPQLRGSCLLLWDDLLPEYPAEPADADALAVAHALAASYGGTAVTQ